MRHHHTGVILAMTVRRHSFCSSCDAPDDRPRATEQLSGLKPLAYADGTCFDQGLSAARSIPGIRMYAGSTSTLLHRRGRP